MDKNPISFLQEYIMAKRKELPNYVMISQLGVGTHINQFHFRVQCDGLTAEGIGSNKKEAKTNAAINMLKLLKLYPNQGPYNPCRPGLIPGPSVPLDSNNSSVTDDHNNSLTDSSAIGVNYIGKLQEITAHKPTTPVYTLKSVSGPPHNSLFTYICNFEGSEVEATGKTKKEAKTLAAKKMLEKIPSKLQINVPDPEKYQSYLDNVTALMDDFKVSEDEKSSMVKSASKALQCYPKINQTGKKVLTNITRSCDEYHTVLKNSLSNDERLLAINQLQDIIKLCENFSKGIERYINPKNILCTALEILKIKVSEVNYLHDKEGNIYGLKLLTNPIISEIGYGNDKVAAENMAVYQIAKTLSIMLL